MKYTCYLLLLLTACSQGEEWTKYLPAATVQLDYGRIDFTELQDLPDGVNHLSTDPQVAHLLLSGPAGNSLLTVFPDIRQLSDTSANWLSEDYQGYEVYQHRDSRYYAAVFGNALWLSEQRVAIEQTIDARIYGATFSAPRVITPGQYLWREEAVPGLLAPAELSYQLSVSDSVMYSPLNRRAEPGNDLSELLALIPRDAEEVRVEADASGKTFAHFRLLGERMLLASEAALLLNGNSLGDESYQSFLIEHYGEEQYLVKLGEKWTLLVPHPADAKNFIDRLMAGSSLLDRPELPELLAGQDELVYLRSWNYRDRVQGAIPTNNQPDWWGGYREGNLTEWRFLGAVNEPGGDPRLAEWTFNTGVERWLAPKGWPHYGIQLQDGQFILFPNELSQEVSLADDRLPMVDNEVALSPPLVLETNLPWINVEGWIDIQGNQLNAPLDLPPTYVYLPAYDEAVIWLATRAGRLLAIRPDGSFWQTAQGRSPNREGHPLVQSPVHLGGDDFDHLLTLDTAGQLIFSDFSGDIIARHDSLYGAEILPLTTDGQILLRRGRSLQSFDKRTGAPFPPLNFSVDDGELAMGLNADGGLSYLLNASGRSLRRMDLNGQTQFLVQLPFRPSHLLVIDDAHWLAYHDELRRWSLYRNELPLITNQRSDLPPQHWGDLLLTVEGEQVVAYEVGELVKL